MMDETNDVGAAQRRIVDHLKRSGSCTTAAIAETLGVTTQAVRPPLAELEDLGLVTSELLSTGTRGRPPIGWSLSALAIGLFPDRHSDLTIELIRAVRAAVGDDGLLDVLVERDRVQHEIISSAFPPDADVATRAEVLAGHRRDQGYMAEVVADGEDLLLIEHHCPVCAAATECQGLCRNELDLFQRVIGEGAEVERTEHLLSGDERCIYRIRVSPVRN